MMFFLRSEKQADTSEFCRIFDIKEPTSNDVKEPTPNIERLVKSLSEQEKERIILLALKGGNQK